MASKTEWSIRLGKTLVRSGMVTLMLSINSSELDGGVALEMLMNISTGLLGAALLYWGCKMEPDASKTFLVGTYNKVKNYFNSGVRVRGN